MAIDTPAKRLSSLDFEEVWDFGIPLPDGAISQADRQHSIFSYAGILIAAGAAAVTVFTFGVILSPESTSQVLAPNAVGDILSPETTGLSRSD